MKRILITGAGGSPATNFVRSLLKAPEKVYLVGTDCDKFLIQRAETNEKHLVPKASEKDYVTILNDIIGETKSEFLHVQNDTEMKVISDRRKELNIKTFLPKKETIDRCINKFESYRLWKKANLGND